MRSSASYKNLKKQTTIVNLVSCNGIGLHTGERVSLKLKPAPTETGILFKRVDLDLKSRVLIKACYANLHSVKYSTTLGVNGITVQTVEHLLAALKIMELDNVIVEVSGPEIPAMDGSALPFIHLLQKAQKKYLQNPRIYLKVEASRMVVSQDKKIFLLPLNGISYTYSIDFSANSLLKQFFSTGENPADLIYSIAPARTFITIDEGILLRNNGLVKGGNTHNALVFDAEGVIDNQCRFSNEPVRHKILDLIGDLTLLGRPLLAQVIAEKCGHAMHAALIKDILENPSCFKYTYLQEEINTKEKELATESYSSPFNSLPNYL